MLQIRTNYKKPYFKRDAKNSFLIHKQLYSEFSEEGRIEEKLPLILKITACCF